MDNYKFPPEPFRYLRLLALLATWLFWFQSSAQVNEPGSDIWNAEYHRQFDFWVGEWDVNLRIQQESGVWEDKVQSTARIYQILDGKAILELWNENKVGEGIKGYSLRYYNEDLEKWELWLNWPRKNQSASSSLEGSFRHERGEFFSEFPKNDSVTITQRYTFCDISPNSLRWDNAYSEDGGKTWKEGTWIMEFSRKEQRAPAFVHGQAVHTYDNGNRCDLAEFNFFDEWVGNWSGKLKVSMDEKWNHFRSNVEIYPILDGCAIMTFMRYIDNGNEIKSFSLSTYNTAANKYEEGVLDNLPNSNFKIRYGNLTRDVLTLVDDDELTKSVWRKNGNQLDWDFYHKVEGAWQHLKSASLSK
ncbi:MAG: hypothetical protein ABJP45_08715 [Cyclobacteriaceae bacterium]